MLIINKSIVLFLCHIFLFLFSDYKVSFDLRLHFASLVNHLMELNILLNHLIKLKLLGLKLLFFSLSLGLLHHLPLGSFFLNEILNIISKPSNLITLNFLHFGLISFIILQNTLGLLKLSKTSVLNLLVS